MATSDIKVIIVNKKIALNIAPLAILIIALAAGCGMKTGAEVEEEPAAAPGDQPMFTLSDIHGNQVSLADVLAEKAVLLAFWHTECGPCVAEIPHLNEIAAANQDKLAVIGVNIREERDHVAAFAAEKNIGYTILLDADGQVGLSYGVRGLPLLVLIGRDGNAYYRGRSSHQAENALGLVIEK
jgi:thiol-disulfide isomerase/thioredoxin